MRIFFNRDSIPLLDELPERYGKKEFRSPTRSTVPLLSLLRHGGDLWREVVRDLGGDADAADLHLEYRVEPQNGKGVPSHTDAMLVQPDRAIAIETKWTEGRYATVQRWLDGGMAYENGVAVRKDDTNRRAVLEGWLSLLQPHAARPLHPANLSGAIYQMVHRAASACALERAPALAYIQFAQPQQGVPQPVARLKDDLTHLWESLGSPDGFPIRLVEVTIIPTAAFDRIRELSKGSPETAAVVRDALLGEPLFEFPQYLLHQISGRPAA